MKTKTAASTRKQSITVKDLKTRKNPKGGTKVFPKVEIYPKQAPNTVSR